MYPDFKGQMRDIICGTIVRLARHVHFNVEIILADSYGPSRGPGSAAGCLPGNQYEIYFLKSP